MRWCSSFFLAWSNIGKVDFLISAVVCLVSVGIFSLETCKGIFCIFSLFLLLAASVNSRFEATLFGSALAAGLACSINCPFASLYYLVYGLGFSIVVGFYLSLAHKKNVHYPCSLPRLLLSFFLSAVMLVFFATSSFEGREPCILLPPELYYLGPVYPYFPGLLAFLVCFLGIHFLEFLQKFVYSQKKIGSLFSAFSISTFDYYWLAFCIAGGIFFIGEDQRLFVNLVIMSTMPFFLEGSKFILEQLSTKKGAHRQYFAWSMCTVLMVPVLLAAVCSFFQPWLKYSKAEKK